MSKQKKQHRLKQRAKAGPPLGNLDGVLPSNEQVVLAESLRTRPPKDIRMRLPQAYRLANNGS